MSYCGNTTLVVIVRSIHHLNVIDSESRQSLNWSQKLDRSFVSKFFWDGRTGGLWHGSRKGKIEDHGYNNFVFPNQKNKPVDGYSF